MSVARKPAGPRRSRRSRWSQILGASLLGLIAAALASPVEAIPAYGRRYGVSCTTCHAPLPPRLNNVGIAFRKLGFRMPDADDEGRLVIKAVPSHGIGDAASIVANVAAARDKEAEPGSSKATLALTEVELAAGTAIGNKVSAQAMFVPWDDGEIELENAEVQFNTGSARHQFLARGGLMQTYLWQKANHGSLTLSTPLVFAPRAVAGVEPFEGFGLGVSQIGAEVGYLYNRLEDGRLRSTILTAAVLNGVTQEGDPARRNTASGADVYLQALQLLGDRNTIGGFFYRGRTYLAPAPGEGLPDASTQRFARYGFFGNYVLLRRFDVVAGGALGWDRSPLLVDEVRFAGLFAEVDVSLTARWIGVYRFDSVDPDRDQPNNSVRAQTVSSTFRADDHLYLTGEYRWVRRNPNEKNWALVVNARLVY
jgi:mono/diheme cytochrome c family protein